MKGYHYTECGLDNIFVMGLDPVTDDNGDEVITIPAINVLHKEIAKGIVTSPAAMTGQEFRFLRTHLGFTQSGLARLLHRDAQTMGRWERGESDISGAAETVLRMLVVEKLELDPVTTEKLADFIHEASKPPIRINKLADDSYRLEDAA